MMLTDSPGYVYSSALQSKKSSESSYYSPGMAYSKELRNAINLQK